MITAVDTNILLDLFLADPVHGERSRAALVRARAEGSLVACEVVWAETSSAFPSGTVAGEWLARIGVGFEALARQQALAAGEAWRIYRQRSGGRQRVAADFLIGMHALHAADRLLTRDKGFFHDYFLGLIVLDPAEGH